MTADELTKLAGGLGVIVSALLGILTWRENQRKGLRESTAQRIDRETAERQGDYERIDKRTQEFIVLQTQELARLAVRISDLERRLDEERQKTNALQGKFDDATLTIKDLTRQNERQADELTRLRAQVHEIQGKVYRGPLSDGSGEEPR